MTLYTVKKVLSPDKGYSCTFRNWRAKSHCRWEHGYDLRFEIEIACHDYCLTEEGWVYDFGGFTDVKAYLDKTFDHKMLVAADDPQLDTLAALAGLDVADVIIVPQVGCEAFARMVYEVVEHILIETGHSTRISTLAITCQENGANSVRYTR